MYMKVVCIYVVCMSVFMKIVFFIIYINFDEMKLYVLLVSDVLNS